LAAITAAVAAAGGSRSAWLRTTLLAALTHPASVTGAAALSARTSVATTNVSPAAKADMMACARAAGVTLGAWVREQALAACPAYVAPAGPTTTGRQGMTERRGSRGQARGPGEPARAFGIPVTAAERVAVDAAASVLGISRAAWLRARLVKAAAEPSSPATLVRLDHNALGLTTHLAVSTIDRIRARAATAGMTPGRWARAQILSALEP
jgi:hypothetical protein